MSKEVKKEELEKDNNKKVSNEKSQKVDKEKKQNTANNGEIVVALIEDEATVKTFYKENGYFRLQPENDTMDPIILDEVTILGKAIGLYRKF